MTAHQEGVTSFDCMATLPTVDHTLRRSIETMPLHTAPSLPVVHSTVAIPATYQLKQQPGQHLAGSPHSGPRANYPTRILTAHSSQPSPANNQAEHITGVKPSRCTCT